MRRFNWKLAALVVATSIMASGILGWAGLCNARCGVITAAFWIVNMPGAAILFLYAITTGFFPGPGEDQITGLDFVMLGVVSIASSIMWATIAGFVFRRKANHHMPDELGKATGAENNKNLPNQKIQRTR